MKNLTVKELKKLLESADESKCVFVHLNKFICSECQNEYYGSISIAKVDIYYPQAVLIEVAKSKTHGYPKTNSKDDK
jgi:hypothetical protein